MFGSIRDILNAALYRPSKLIACISVREIRYPTLHIETKPGRRSCWSSAIFIATIDPFDYSKEEFKHVTLSTSSEQWRYDNARIALVPGQDVRITAQTSRPDPLEFVIIFSDSRKVK